MSAYRQGGTPAASTGPGAKGWLVFPAAALVATGIGVLSLGVVFYAADVHGATAAQIGCLAATWSLSYVLGCALFRPLSERLLPHHSVTGAAAVMGLAVLAVLACRHLALVYVSYVVYGLATALFWPPLMGWLSTGLEGQPLNRTMGWFNLSWSCGGIVGPVIAGALARSDARLPVAVAGSLYVIAALWAVWVVRRLPSVVVDRSAAASAGPVAATAAGADASTPLRYPAWVGLVAAYAAMGVVFNVFPLAAPERLGLSKVAIGVVLFVRALATSVALVALGRFTAWHFRAAPMAAGLVLFAGVLAALPQARSAVAAALLLAAVGVLLAQCYANSLFHGVAGSRKRASRMATHEALLSVGLVCGGACGGILFQTAGYAVVCRAAAALLLLAAAVAAGFACTAPRALARDVISPTITDKNGN